jgi:hypothetical protein
MILLPTAHNTKTEHLSLIWVFEMPVLSPLPTPLDDDIEPDDVIYDKTCQIDFGDTNLGFRGLD